MGKYQFNAEEKAVWINEGNCWVFYANCYGKQRIIFVCEDDDLTAYNLGKPWRKFNQNRIREI